MDEPQNRGGAAFPSALGMDMDGINMGANARPALLPWASAFFLALGVASANGDPAAPPFESAIGYLTVLDPDAAAPCGKLSFPPDTVLPILKTSSEGFLVLAVFDETSGVAFIQRKELRFLGAREALDGKTLHFERGGSLPLKPLPLSVGEELPIKEDRGDHWLCGGVRLGISCPVLLPKNAKAGTFSKQSAWACFVERQKSAGLSEWKGKWIDSEMAAFFAEEERREAATAKSREEILVALARKGYVVRPGGNVLQGKLKGRGGGKIYFISEAGDEWWISPEMMDDGTFEELLARARIAKASRTLDRAEAVGKVNEGKGEAISLAKSAGRLAGLVPKNLEIESRRAARVGQRSEAFIEKAESDLKAVGLAAHEGKVLPAAELEWRLKGGQIFFQRKHWILPSQVCGSCEGKGQVICPACEGERTVSVRCPKCVRGMIVCPICAGTAEKPCPKCNAAGFVEVRCSYCGGGGSVQNPTPTTYGGGGSNVVVSPSGGVIVSMGPWFPTFISNQPIPCMVCGGTGMNRATCPMCNSTTRVPCPVRVKCPACGGRGVSTVQCPECKGKGRIQCRSCGGAGFVGAEIPWKP